MNKFILMIIGGCIGLVGCSRISFVQYQQAHNQQELSRWHHTIVNGLIELSPPIDLRQVCGDKTWNYVTTETSVANVAVGILNPALPYLSLYSPQTARIQCFQVAAPKNQPVNDSLR
ncbi:MAG: Bor family protein [Cellvibrionaceae bacterium]|nr:Bor family protein [Cellvibrionaceae bacterium]MCV6626990.1 Bor family protein [Cellvibrionaceae bacterium]